MTKKENGPQLKFLIDDRLKIPQHLSNSPYGNKIIEFLTKNSLFIEKPNGLALVMDLTSSDRRIFNPNNWQQEEVSQVSINPNYALAIIVVDGLISSEEIQKMIEEIKTNLNKNGGEIFIFESGLQIAKESLENLKQERSKVFLNQGFLKFALKPPIKPKKDQLITELLTQARLRKVGEHTHRGVDLLTPKEDDPPWKKEWRKGIIPNIIKKYTKLGFTEIDTSEIEECLRNSTYPKRDLNRANDGFGVEAKASCGCSIKVSLDGEIFILNKCQDHPEGIPNPLEIKKEVSPQYSLGEIRLKQSCDCGANLIQTIVRKKEDSKSQTTFILIEKKCPHCGVISVDQKKVSSSSIIQS